MALYVKIRGRVHGPITEQQLQRLVRRGVVTPQSEVSEDGQHWRRAAELVNLFGAPDAAAPQAMQASGGSTWWYLDEAGKSVGPVPEQQIRSLLQTGDLNGETMVWSPDLPDWRPLRDTSLANHVGTFGPGVATAVASIPRRRVSRRARLPWFSEQLLLSGEEILYVGEVSPFFFLGHLVTLVAATALAMLWLSAYVELLVPMILVIVVLWVAISAALILHYLFSGCIVTDKRVIGTTGVLRRSIAVVHLSQISAILVRQGLLGRLLDYGTLIVTCAGAENPWWWSSVVFPYYARIIELAKAISASSLRSTGLTSK